MNSGKRQVYLSYADGDAVVGTGLIEALQGAGVPCWADQGIRHGERWIESLTSALDDAAAFVFVMSPEFLGTQWAMFELGLALSRARTEGALVIPVLAQEAPLPRAVRPFASVDLRSLGVGQAGREIVRRIASYTGTESGPPRPWAGANDEGSTRAATPPSSTVQPSEERAASPVHEAAILVRDRIRADAVAIYETFPEDQDSFFLTGSCGADPDRQGQYAVLRRSPAGSPDEWIGLTTFVAFHKQRLNLPQTPARIPLTLAGRTVHVTIDVDACEISNPGPFLAEPVLHGDDVLGVIRAIRRDGRPPFDDTAQEILRWIARFLALSFRQERMRADLIRGLNKIAVWKDDAEALELIAREAGRLVHGEGHAVAVLLHDPSRGSESRPFYTLRAPQRLADRLEPRHRDYPFEAKGLTPQVLFRNEAHVFSLNLPRDTAEGGPYHHVGHESKPGELDAETTRSFMAVPIPRQEPQGWPFGAIRVTSPHPDAFSPRDIVTLKALALQTGILLRNSEEMRDRQALFETAVDTSPRPIIAIDAHGRVRAYNEAMVELLGIPKDEALGRPLLEVAYARKKKLAVANGRALQDAAGRLRGHYTTVYRRCPQGWLTIPVRVDASYLHAGSTEVVTGAVAYLQDLRGPGAAGEITVAGRNAAMRTADSTTAREMRRIAKELHKDTDLPILICGETGSGKELLATAAAEALERPECRRINCAGLSESILESELFGAEKGIVTGVEAHAGVFDPSFEGTVILDEIQELSMPVQAKLLRVLDTGMVRRLGGLEEKSINIRVIALTNADLDALVRDGKFRSDLKFRLDGITFQLKPLRERRADIMQLADYFLSLERAKRPDGPEGFASGALRAMLAHSWSGNVRELRKAVGKAFSRCLALKRIPLLIPLAALPEYIQAAATDASPSQGRADDEDTPAHLATRLAALERFVTELDDDVRRLKGQEAPVTAVSKASYVALLQTSIEADPRLRQTLEEGGIEVLKAFFKSKGHEGLGRSTLFELRKRFFGRRREPSAKSVQGRRP